MEKDMNSINPEALDNVSGGVEWADWDSECSCGGRHDWFFVCEVLRGWQQNNFLYECSKCHKQCERCPV